MKMTSKLHISFSFFIITLAMAFPGAIQANINAKEGYIKCSLICVTNEEPLEGLHYRSNGEWQQLDVPSARSSQPFEYYGPELIEFFSEPFSEEDIRPKPLATVRLKPASAEQILIFFQGEVSPEAIRVLALDEGGGAFPEGNLLFYNISSEEVIGLFNGSMHKVVAGGQVLEPFGGEQARGFRIQLAVQEQENEVWKRVYASGLPVFPKTRWLVIWFAEGFDPWLLMIRDRVS